MVAPVHPGDRRGHRRAGSGLALAGLGRARFSVSVFFAILGLANGVWLSRIPAVKDGLGLSDGTLGIALLASPVGLVTIVVFSSRIARRAGTRRPTMIVGAGTALLPVAMGLAPGLLTLMASLLGFGLFTGMTDVAMNSQAVLVERAAGRPVMNSFHASYSSGGLAGALLGGLFATAGISPVVNFAAVGVPLAAAALLAGRWLMHDPGRRPDPAPAAPSAAAAARSWRAMLASWTPAMLLMALLSACSLLGEGSAEGWSAVYLHDNLAASAGLATLGYAGFSLAMAGGRLSGDWLNARLGSARLMRGCGVIAAAGLAAALAGHSPAAAIAGFTLFGAGLSCTFPLLLSAAGDVDAANPAHGIARVAGAGYAGMLTGPPLIGGLATAAGLRLALLLPVGLAVVIAAGAPVASRRPAPG